jgi:hypothetical protein
MKRNYHKACINVLASETGTSVVTDMNGNFEYGAIFGKTIITISLYWFNSVDFNTQN